MSFDQLIHKVTQAEDALEAQERRVAADWRQLKASWRAGWTPGRIVIAGLASGFLLGRAEPLRAVAKGGGAMQLITMLSGLFAGGSAQAAASEAEHAPQEVALGDAAATAEDMAVAVAPEAVSSAVTARVAATEQAARSAAEPIEP